jgi:hypothetical protein
MPTHSRLQARRPTDCVTHLPSNSRGLSTIATNENCLGSSRHFTVSIADGIDARFTLRIRKRLRVNRVGFNGNFVSYSIRAGWFSRKTKFLAGKTLRVLRLHPLDSGGSWSRLRAISGEGRSGGNVVLNVPTDFKVPRDK